MKLTSQRRVSPWLFIVLTLVVAWCSYMKWQDLHTPRESHAPTRVAKPATRTEATPLPPHKKGTEQAVLAHTRVAITAPASPTTLPLGAQTPVAAPSQARAAPASDASFIDLFAVPPTPPLPAAPPPMAPALPFRIESILQLDQTTVIALRMNGTLYLVCQACQVPGAIHLGGKITDKYQLNGITAQNLDFIYLPLQTHQQLALNG